MLAKMVDSSSIGSFSTSVHTYLASIYVGSTGFTFFRLNYSLKHFMRVFFETYYSSIYLGMKFN
jgi:hypothetical protein